LFICVALKAESIVESAKKKMVSFVFTNGKDRDNNNTAFHTILANWPLESKIIYAATRLGPSLLHLFISGGGLLGEMLEILCISTEHYVPPLECGSIVSNKVFVVKVVEARTAIPGNELQRIEWKIVSGKLQKLKRKKNGVKILLNRSQ
jgi:hypothetical protein